MVATLETEWQYTLKYVMNMIGELRYYLEYASFGGFGGLVYLMLTGKCDSIGAVVKAIVTSGFVGLLAGMFAQEVGMSIVLTCVVSGIFGCAGGLGLIWLLAMMQKKLGMTHQQDLKHIKDSIIGKEPPEIILSSLVQNKTITFEECLAILQGDTAALLRAMENGAISGAEFGRVHKWATALRNGTVDDNE